MASDYSDLTNVAVVRDRDGIMWGVVGPDRWLSLEGSDVRIGTEGLGLHHGPLTPILDLDGQPIVRTVGDLTPRHQLSRPRIRVAGREGPLKVVRPSEAYPGTLAIIWGHWWEDVTPDEPCEVLP